MSAHSSWAEMRRVALADPEARDSYEAARQQYEDADAVREERAAPPESDQPAQDT
ncbi:hypothetical protein [Streptomyces sp. NBC_01465]|uniref:hypothetical protein n=1 Tax=Streptomyces sp. NBC_01465 TaxID=2903878 RepID=UPI002E311F8C|nr:hypothetical protein [Streptomyces sp. NBC_01465]